MKTERETTKQEERHSIHLFRRGQAASAARRGMAGVLAVTMLGFSTGAIWGQEAPPPPDGYDAGAPPQAYQPLPPQQLDQLVAPIALYPDSLVAQVLAASTYPQQVVSAEEMVQENNNLPPSELADMANEQPWDPAVKSLVAFPQVLADLNQNMTWTTDLGNAYYNQPQDVMSAVQDMRQRAYAAGTLRSTPQLAVDYDPGDIVIAPVSPNIVYVPYYNPWVVYGAPLPVYAHYYWGPPPGVVFGAGVAIGFGFGFAIGAFSHFGWGYHNWAPNWQSRTVVYNHTTFISNSTTVINHGYYGRFDRNPQAVAFNRNQAAAFGNHGVNNAGAFRGAPAPNGNAFNRGQAPNGGQNGWNRGGQTFNQGNAYNRGTQAPNPGNSFNRGAYNNRSAYQPSQPNAGGAYNTRPSFQPNQQRFQGGAYNTRSAPAYRPQPQPQPQQHASAPHPAPQYRGGGGGDHGGGHDHR